MPQVVLLFLCKVVIWLENGEVILWRTTAELVLPFSHLVAAPAEYRSVVHAEQLVWNDKVFIDAYNTSETFTIGAGTYGRVE